MTIKELAARVARHETTVEALSPASPIRARAIRALDKARADYDQAVRAALRGLCCYYCATDVPATRFNAENTSTCDAHAERRGLR